MTVERNTLVLILCSFYLIMKLRNGKIKKDYSKCWWYPYILRNHIHKKHCYCAGFMTFNEWLKKENEMDELIHPFDTILIANVHGVSNAIEVENQVDSSSLI